MAVASVSGISPSDWDRMVPADDPFMLHAFLLGLEKTKCVSAMTGWRPRHLLAYENDVLMGAMPLYEKHHSYGEFVFDFEWAQAAEEAELPYYPKLVSAVPFTPVTGARLLVAPEADSERVRGRLLAALDALLSEGNYSSAHVLFPNDADMAFLERAGYIPRLGFQFHWTRDPGWHTFEDFQRSMRASVRKQVKKERKIAHSQGLTFKMLAKGEITEAHREAFWHCYTSTIEKHHSHAYLNRAFVRHLFDHFSQHLLLAVAKRGDRVVACALFLYRGTGLYGRYWGALEPIPMLHFELCYYQPITWALEHGITRFEAGAQGMQKLKRGLLPRACHSAHRFSHEGFGRAIRAHLKAERRHILAHMAHCEAHGPFHRA